MERPVLLSAGEFWVQEKDGNMTMRGATTIMSGIDSNFLGGCGFISTINILDGFLTLQLGSTWSYKYLTK